MIAFHDMEICIVTNVLLQKNLFPHEYIDKILIDYIKYQFKIKNHLKNKEVLISNYHTDVFSERIASKAAMIPSFLF